jgi:hypothetical protein
VDLGYGKESSYSSASADHELEESSNIPSMPVDLGYGKESSFSYLSTSANQEHEESSNIPSTPVELGYGKESSFSYLSASADQEHEESSNIHSSSTPVDLGYGTESSYSFLSASADQEHEESSNIHSSSMPVDHANSASPRSIGASLRLIGVSPRSTYTSPSYSYRHHQVKTNLPTLAESSRQANIRPIDSPPRQYDGATYLSVLLNIKSITNADDSVNTIAVLDQSSITLASRGEKILDHDVSQQGVVLQSPVSEADASAFKEKEEEEVRHCVSCLIKHKNVSFQGMYSHSTAFSLFLKSYDK